ncbi:heat shock 70 kDa protein 12A-like [Mytilus californianus]|uniref:heat shock 70 kDa protein 12A-like n=1 Tax=Mytilus californianus TaxID=6549 RepID=UPI0022463AE8|nr:heat shock 70 kDa protein 12A-like [Mytilus californianus]
MSKLSDDYLFVVAIDFDTTYSGYAFSSRDDFKRDPLKIVANQAWNAGSQRHLSLKTPTCLLLDNNEELVSFGYEAENKYADIVLDGQQNEYFFFQRFKMQLYKNKDIKGEMIIEDVTGKPLTAMKVFAKSIEALMQHLFDIFDQRGKEIKKTDIRWVLTVPAIWSDAAKQFIWKSAELTGFPNNQLLIALEPEAASLYCQDLPIERLQGAEKGYCMTEDGTRYMVVDIGGGTADITIHQKLSKGNLKEICRASGGDCGGISVDNSFYQIFIKLLGAPLLNIMKREDPSAHLDIFRELEAIKRTVDKTNQDKVTMAIPRAILDDICKTHLHEDFAAVIEASPYKDRMKVRYDKLRIETDLIKNLFKEASQKIIQRIDEALNDKNAGFVSVILLVGGFSDCKIIQDEIKAKFPKMRVIVPEEAGLAVLKGAVLFGHRPEQIVSRIARYTYGVQYRPRFISVIHEPARQVDTHGISRCIDAFDIFVRSDSEVKLGSKIRKEFSTVREFQSFVSFPVFQTIQQSPKYTDEDSCTHIATLRLAIPNPSRYFRDLDVEFVFGHTELKVTGYEMQSGAECETALDLI